MQVPFLRHWRQHDHGTAHLAAPPHAVRLRLETPSLQFHHPLPSIAYAFHSRHQIRHRLARVGAQQHSAIRAQRQRRLGTMRTVSGYRFLTLLRNSTPVMPGMRWSDTITSTSEKPE
jgi:hypothetical protein